jgi:N-dimethylarginine dimethylaminohydrolase
MAKPVRHRNKWRVRWSDEMGQRRSEVHEEHRHAVRALRAHEARVDEVLRGVRRPEVPDETFEDLAAYWLEHRAPQKRSGADDESICVTSITDSL